MSLSATKSHQVILCTGVCKERVKQSAAGRWESGSGRVAGKGPPDHGVDRGVVCVSPCSAHDCSAPEAGAQRGLWQAPRDEVWLRSSPHPGFLAEALGGQVSGQPGPSRCGARPCVVSRRVWSRAVSGLVRFYGAANILCNLTATRLAIRFFLKSFLK